MPPLLLQTSFLGDMILTTPAIEYLAKQGEKPAVLATPASAPLLANNPHVARVLTYDKRGEQRGVRGMLAMAKQLRQTDADTAFFAQGSVRSALIALGAGIHERVGFDSSEGARLYNRRVPYDDTVHHARRLLDLVGAPRVLAPRPRLYPGEVERAAVDTLLEAGGLAAGEPFVALAPGSIWPTKRWPYYADLAQRVAELRLRVVVIGSRDDAPLAQEIAALAGTEIVDATGKLSLLASAELIGRALLLVTNDSAPEHLASAMGTPTLAIFGPTVPEFGFGPLAPRRAVAGHPSLDCRPCDRHGPRRCPLGHWRCMRELGPDAIFEKAQSLLAAPTKP